MENLIRESLYLEMAGYVFLVGTVVSVIRLTAIIGSLLAPTDRAFRKAREAGWSVSLIFLFTAFVFFGWLTMHDPENQVLREEIRALQNSPDRVFVPFSNGLPDQTGPGMAFRRKADGTRLGGVLMTRRGFAQLSQMDNR